MNAGGEHAKALAMNRNTLAVIDEFKGKAPPKLLMVQGMAWFGIAESQMDSDAREALADRMKSMDVLKRAAAATPEDAEIERYLSLCEKRLAVQYFRGRDAARAAASLRDSIAIDEGRVKRSPLDTVAKLDLALGEAYLGSVVRRQGDPAGARRFLSEAIATRAEVLAADPRNVRVRQLLATDYPRMADWMKEDGDLKGSLEMRQKALDLGPLPGAQPARGSGGRSAPQLRTP
jgi:tetratricopeptide (TPR) repeat protein